ncbi:Uncharacterised protein [Raoultella ornithinolytica]|nr:Uncharacterised protein [Raoultella ornithinolytica]
MIHAHEVIDLLTRPRKVFADIFFHFHALRRELIFHHLLDQRAASTATGRRPGTAFYRRDIAGARADRPADITFSDVVARADLRAVRQRRYPQRFWRAPLLHRQNQAFRARGQRHRVQHHLQQRGVIAGIAHQHAAQQRFVLLADDNFLVDLPRTIRPLVALATGRASLGVAERGYIDAQQFQFGAHIGAAEARLFSSQHCRRRSRHLVARRHQAIDFVLPQGTFANRQHLRIGGAALIVDDDPAALSYRQSAAARQRILRTNPGGKDHHVGSQRSAIGKVQHQAIITARNTLSRLAGMDTDANIIDFLPQHRGARAIQLDRHQIRRKLHHVGFQPQLSERVGGLQPQQPAANHHPAFCAAGAGGNTVEVVEGAVDETALQIVARHRRNEWI